MAATYYFKFSHQTGSYIISAKSRKEATETFVQKYGIPLWFVEKHYKIKKVWSVKE